MWTLQKLTLKWPNECSLWFLPYTTGEQPYAGEPLTQIKSVRVRESCLHTHVDTPTRRANWIRRKYRRSHFALRGTFGIFFSWFFFSFFFVSIFATEICSLRTICKLWSLLLAEKDEENIWQEYLFFDAGTFGAINRKYFSQLVKWSHWSVRSWLQNGGVITNGTSSATYTQTLLRMC